MFEALKETPFEITAAHLIVPSFSCFCLVSEKLGVAMPFRNMKFGICGVRDGWDWDSRESPALGT